MSLDADLEGVFKGFRWPDPEHEVADLAEGLVAAGSSTTTRVLEGRAGLPWARRSRGRARLSRGAAVQVAALLWVYVLYDACRAWLTGPRAVAASNARGLVALERVMHLDVEVGFQHLVLHVGWLVTLCNLCYSLTHLIVPVIVFIVLYRHAPDRYTRWRDTWLVLLGLALVCFWLYPLMPPRLMPGSYHFVDTSTHYLTITREPLRHALGNTSSPSPGSWAANNPYAAMPSLHFGWALWAALALWPLARRGWVRVLLVGYPIVMLVSVIVTANHWLLDILGAALILGVALMLATALHLARRSGEEPGIEEAQLPGRSPTGARGLSTHR